MSRSFADQTTDRIDFAGTAPVLYNQTNATILAWFKRGTAPSSGGWPTIFFELAAFNKKVSIFMIAGGVDQAKLDAAWRTPTANVSITSTNTFDDDAWHRLCFVRNSSSPFIELFVDGVSEASSATDPSTDATDPTTEFWGNNNNTNASFGGELARCAFVAGTSLAIQDAESFLLTARTVVKMDHWIEMIGSSPEPDWSGNGNNGTVTAAVAADHIPVGPIFGFDDSQQIVSEQAIFLPFYERELVKSPLLQM